MCVVTVSFADEHDGDATRCRSRCAPSRSTTWRATSLAVEAETGLWFYDAPHDPEAAALLLASLR